MMTVTKFANAHHAASYYDHDDYYAESGQAPSSWHGKGAERLGLFGAVDRELMHDIMNGELPTGDLVGEEKEGKWEHAPGFDATFSAPKSVSVMALAAGDSRLVDAHTQAVKAALDFVEDRVAACRIREDGTVRRENTGNLLIASFGHSTSRKQDPQLHSHNLIMNVTQDENGRWRSLEAKELFHIHHAADRVYKQSLAQQTLAMGYNIERTKHGWEIAGLKDLSSAFSSRTVAIDAWLEAKGYDRETASAEIRQRATLATRPPKELGIDRGELVGNWKARSAELGYDLDKSVPDAEKTRSVMELKEEAVAVADKAVASAIAHISEGLSRFSRKQLIDTALKEASGWNADLQDLTDAVDRSKELRSVGEGRYTTEKAIKTEKAMLSIERQGREQGEALSSATEALEVVAIANEASKYPWNQGQKAATAGILSCGARIQALQGDAGTAKTTTVIKTVAAVASEKGIKVVGLAPTAAAAAQLAEGAGLEDSITVDSFLLNSRRNADEEQGPQIWIVDEASMMSARKMKDLLRLSEERNARVLLVGDIKQLASVEAGAAFKQLQEAGMETHVLDEIVRQTNLDTKAAVEASIKGDIRKAMEHIERSGEIIEIEDPTERKKEMAMRFLELPKKERQETMVVDGTRAGRNELNSFIRDGLREDGQLTGIDVVIDRWEAKDMSEEERTNVDNYDVGDYVTFGRSLKSVGVEGGEYYRISDIDLDNGKIKLLAGNGETLTWKPENAAGKVSAYTESTAQITAGDEIRWRKNNKDLGLKNGDRLNVKSVENGLILAEDKKGREIAINTKDRKEQHFDYAYAATVNSVQGDTKEGLIGNIAAEDEAILSQSHLYVTISRAKRSVIIYTDNKEKMIEIIERQKGYKETALNKIELQAEEEQKQKTEDKVNHSTKDAGREQGLEGGQQNSRPKELTPEQRQAIETESQKQYQVATGKSREDFKKDRETERNRDSTKETSRDSAREQERENGQQNSRPKELTPAQRKAIEAESQKQYQVATGKSREDFKKDREAVRNRDREHTYEIGM